jgi:hypothetical protein
MDLRLEVVVVPVSAVDEQAGQPASAETASA